MPLSAHINEFSYNFLQVDTKVDIVCISGSISNENFLTTNIMNTPQLNYQQGIAHIYITQQRDIYDTVIFLFLQIYYGRRRFVRIEI